MGVNKLVFCTISALFWCILTIGTAVLPEGHLELKMVQVVFRHGNRTPPYPYYNDPNENETFYPYGWDQLDAAGRQRAYDLGRYLRDLYGKFVGDEYIPGVVNISSTDATRTKMSAQVVAAGLFPPSEAQKWGSSDGLGQDWQPITFDYTPREEDDLLYMALVPCPAYWEEREKATVHPAVTAVLEDDPELVEALATNAHVDRDVHAIEIFHVIVRIEDFYHMIVPDWVKPFYPDRLVKIGKMHFVANLLTRKMQRLWGGPILKHFLEQMDLAKEGNAPKMWLYSAHDDTMSNLGMAMRVWEDIYPDFSSAIIVELHGDQAGNFFVKTLFHNDTSRLPYPLKVQGCTELCPFDELKSILDDVIPRDWEAECLQMNGSPTNFPTLVFLVAVISSSIIPMRFNLNYL